MFNLLRQAFKVATNHPDMALFRAIDQNDLDAVKKAFAAGANPDSEKYYFNLGIGAFFPSTPLAHALVGDKTSLKIITEILSHKPDTTKPDIVGGTVGHACLESACMQFPKFRLLLESGLFKPELRQLKIALTYGTAAGCQDVAEFFFNHSDATRQALREEGEWAATMTANQGKYPDIAKRVYQKMWELSNPHTPSPKPPS